MAVEVERPGTAARVSNFYQEVLTEMRKVTWPDREQTLDATWRIIVFVLGIGAVIYVLDILLQFMLVRLPASILSGR
jgi:preprotein translocase subunit SecE